ncbi:IS66 family insertion sequence element accessory protein TnpB [Limosilactobacillus reuteri]|uniref:IS66 family insertion sequence element accessory protein TnpB n=1 Tax=Limosilactobacillus reuteri TaxID=1598 RepID=UPI003D076A11
MLVNWHDPDHIYLFCGKTDLLKGIDDLAIVVTENYGLELYNNSLFLFFLGGRNHHFKGLFWDGEGFVMLYKRFENGHLSWPRNNNEAKELSSQQLDWLLHGLNPFPTRKIMAAHPGTF